MLSDWEEMKLLPHSLFLLRRKGNKSCCCSEQGGNTYATEYGGTQDVSGRGLIWPDQWFPKKHPKHLKTCVLLLNKYRQHLFFLFFFLEAELIYSGLIICIIKGFNTYIFFLGFFSSVVYFKMLTIVPCAIHWDLAVYSTTSSVPGTVLCLGHPQNRHVRA